MPRSGATAGLSGAAPVGELRTVLVVTCVSTPPVSPEVKFSDQSTRLGAGLGVPLLRKSVIRSIQVPLTPVAVAPSKAFSDSPPVSGRKWPAEALPPALLKIDRGASWSKVVPSRVPPAVVPRLAPLAPTLVLLLPAASVRFRS